MKEFSLENVAAKPGYSSTAVIIEYLSYVPLEVIEMAEKEYRVIWYSQKKKEIEFWRKLKKGYEEAIKRYAQKLRYIRMELSRLEELEWEYRLVIKRKEIQRRIQKLLKKKTILENRLRRYLKIRKELEWIQEGDYRKTVWWKKGFAAEPPSMVRIIQKAIEDYWNSR
jgi:hypothetical protein